MGKRKWKWNWKWGGKRAKKERLHLYNGVEYRSKRRTHQIHEVRLSDVLKS